MTPDEITALVGTLRDWGYPVSNSDLADLIAEYDTNDYKEIEENSQGPFSRDSLTSKQAALENIPRSGTQRRRVFEAIATRTGTTRDEIAAALNLPDSSTDARVWELKKGGFVMDSDMTKRTRNQGVAAILTLTPKGVTAWRKLHG
jgi:hypothetical protein